MLIRIKSRVKLDLDKQPNYHLWRGWFEKIMIDSSLDKTI